MKTELDRLISDQQEMLDKLYEEYNELMTKKMDDSMALLAEGNEIARNSRDVIWKECQLSGLKQHLWGLR